jgi:hypothetical protein
MGIEKTLSAKEHEDSFANCKVWSEFLHFFFAPFRALCGLKSI